MPKRGLGSAAGRIALLHAVAHIEFNAIDLACDMVARFVTDPAFPDTDTRNRFVSDWLSVADDEARHFMMMCKRLESLESSYGDLPAHDGLWQAAQDTSEDVLDRLAIAPLVFEARGLDVTPGMIEKLRTVNDHTSADVLSVIYQDEIGHVAVGSHWFSHVCSVRDLMPEAAFLQRVQRFANKALKPPFNIRARDAANLPISWYMPPDVDGAAPSLVARRTQTD